ncbi:hypothetical protein STENM327S_07123 [Streptomyces tendae]
MTERPKRGATSRGRRRPGRWRSVTGVAARTVRQKADHQLTELRRRHFLTLVQTQDRPTGINAAHRTAADAMDAACALEVWDDMTVEVALSVMVAARTGHLVVDADGQNTDLVTRARLNAVRDGLGYSDQVRLRDITESDAPFTSPLTTVAEAEHAMRHRRLGSLPVVDEHGNALGILALSR